MASSLQIPLLRLWHIAGFWFMLELPHSIQLVATLYTWVRLVFQSLSTRQGLLHYPSVGPWEPGNKDSQLQGRERLTGKMKFFDSGKWLSISSIHRSSLCTWLSLKVVRSKNTEFLLSWITGHHACSHEPSCTQFSWTRIQLCFNINKYNNLPTKHYLFHHKGSHSCLKVHPPTHASCS